MFGVRLKTSSGLNLHYSGFNKEIEAEPGVEINYIASENGTLNFGPGLHSQLQPKALYFYHEFDPATESYLSTNT